jgi:photosystem II stability/assembly factor-like uncharacterized protein
MTKATYDDTLLVTLGGENRGIYRSNDDGRSWQQVGDGPAVDVKTIATHPANERMLYAGTFGGTTPVDGRLWYSTDKGLSWKAYEFNLPANAEGQFPAVNALTVDPNHPGILYIGTEGQGLYRLQSGYAGYAPIGGTPSQNLYVRDVVATVDSPVYAVTTEGLIVIEGDTWHKIDTLPDAAVSLAIDPQNPKTLYVGTVGYGAHRSSDGGQTWQPINRDLGLQPGVILRIPAIVVDEANPHHLALATAFSVGSLLVGDGVYESFDAGESWTKLAENRELVHHLTIEDGRIYAATAKGLVRYGALLSPVSSDTLRAQVNGLTTPSGLQSLVLVLTAAVAGWMLVGRLNWLPRRA